MAELRAKISAALNTIEKSGANLHDDTYLDKTITGLEKELKLIQVNGSNEIILFLQESSIDTFCWKNFESEEDQLQNFVFKLCKVVCQSFHQWIEKCVEKFTNMKKWPMSIPTFELLATVHDQKVVEINTKFVELTWHRILARILLCSNDGQSYFWRKSAGVLLSAFIIKVIKTKDLESSLTQRVNQVFSDLLRANSELCVAAIKKVATQILTQTDEGERVNIIQEIEKLPFMQDENLLPFEANIALKMLEDNNYKVCLYLSQKSDSIDRKTWISSLKHLSYDTDDLDFSDLDIFSEIANEDYKLIPSLIRLEWENLSSKLWEIILHQLLESFLPSNNGDSNYSKGPSKFVTIPADLKMFHSLLSSLVSLIHSESMNLTLNQPFMSEKDWKTIINLTLVPEMEPVSRSLVIKVISELIETGKNCYMDSDCAKIEPSLEALSSQLWHLVRYKDWETKDALLYCLSSEKLKSDLKEVPKVLLNLAITNLEHESSFVKKAAIKFLSKLWQIQPDCWPEFHDRIDGIFREETEAIVRRELALFILISLDPHKVKTIESMLLASKDFDWEVKSVAFKFWSRCFDEKLEQHEAYDALIKDLKENRILEGLDMFTQEYEKDLQIDIYKWLCSVSQRLSTKYPQVPLISSGDTNGDEKKKNSS